MTVSKMVIESAYGGAAPITSEFYESGWCALEQKRTAQSDDMDLVVINPDQLLAIIEQARRCGLLKIVGLELGERANPR